MPQPPSSERAENVEDYLPPSLRHLETKINFVSLLIKSSSKMQQKVRPMLGLLRHNEAGVDGRKLNVMVLRATANCASKLIAIVEIAKRELGQEQVKWWQYSNLSGVKQHLTIPHSKPKYHKPSNSSKGQADEEARGDSMLEQDDHSDHDQTYVQNDYETMSTPTNQTGIQDLPKTKTVPSLTIFLATARIPEFVSFCR